MEFPKRAAERRGEDACCSCTLCPYLCCCCGACCGRSKKPAQAQGNTLRIVQGGQEPRALEFMQVRAENSHKSPYLESCFDFKLLTG